VCSSFSLTTVPLVNNVSDTSNTTQPDCACVRAYRDRATVEPWYNDTLEVHIDTPTAPVFECCAQGALPVHYNVAPIAPQTRCARRTDAAITRRAA